MSLYGVAPARLPCFTPPPPPPPLTGWPEISNVKGGNPICHPAPSQAVASRRWLQWRRQRKLLLCVGKSAISVTYMNILHEKII